ncbi:MAG: hypothetical protein ACM3XR_06525 [Bacillota bacterium]
MGGRRGKSREIIINHAGEFSESEAIIKILKLIAGYKGRCALPDECGRKVQHRDLRKDKQG